ncbi:5'-methylthioadenosine phosphorylase [Neisseria sp. HSC-16F19]|nr:S-methyl-5'-thioinosine phosphorylase [Neisseria sp. HSC-16F19]MCP2041265.1 5'-methylthioadenosine phosphorylase [Neisseria sp. HSC-16F19]
MLAIIGGSGLSTLPEVSFSHKQIVRTPYGLPVAPLYFGRMGTQEIVFLPRHGTNHVWAPHEINYRANIWAMREAGADSVVAVTAVLSLHGHIAPGSLMVPHDIIDYTHGRAHTFFEGQEQPVVHTDFSHPYDAALRREIIRLARKTGLEIGEKGVYACTQGPRWPTAAEAARYARDGGDVVGMTAMPEAVLARELGLPYVHVCGVLAQAPNVAGARNGADERRDNSRRTIAHIRQLLAALDETESV